MHKEEIVELIKNGESVTVEFKEGFDKKTVETVVAFSNTVGGVILIGVTDKGEVKRWDCFYIGKTRAKYEAIRAKIQQSVANHARKFKRLMTKYGEIERNKVHDFIHKLTRRITDETVGLSLVLEDLKGLRNSTSKRIKIFNTFSRKVQ